MPRFTVLGAEGFIGRNLVRFLASCGHEVIAPKRDEETGNARALGIVVYCIGVTVDYAIRPLDTVDAHVCSLTRLLRRGGFDRLLYLSSVRVYDDADKETFDEGAELHFVPHRAQDLYAISKAMGEALTHHGGRSGIVARLANVYDNALDNDDFLCRLVQQCRGTAAIEIESDPEGARDYIHVDDVVRAIEAIASRGDRRVYNVATGRPLPNRELAALCHDAFGTCITFRSTNATPSLPTIDIRRLRQLGLDPRPASKRLPAILGNLRRAAAS